MLRQYLDRIGIDEDTAHAMTSEERKPNKSDLELLLRAHLKSVPFENLSQHTHPAGSSSGHNNNKEEEEKQYNEVQVTKLPSLDVDATLQKIVVNRRGGFCWEINVAFAWLLRSLGYTVRFGCSHVVLPGGCQPGHLCLYVDNISDGTALHVDPGFADAPRAPMPAAFGNVVNDTMIGDAYTFEKINHHNSDDDPHTLSESLKQSPEQKKRFSAVLMRSRKRGFGGSPMNDLIGMEAPEPTSQMTPPEPIYVLNFDDNLEVDCVEFQEGLATVLREDDNNLFHQKRMCIILRDEGFDFVGSNYCKEIRHGREVSRQDLTDEGAYRDALERIAGIRL